jgi:putative transcriptional regulator
MREYDKPLHVSEFAELIEGNLITYYNRMLNGHTIIDSLRAILELNSFDFYKLYGWNSERALMFTQVSTGRSPMVAVRVASLKPAAVVLHGIKKEDIDRIAVKISEIERIPLICSNLPIKQLIEKLRSDAV